MINHTLSGRVYNIYRIFISLFYGNIGNMVTTVTTVTTVTLPNMGQCYRNVTAMLPLQGHKKRSFLRSKQGLL